MNPAVALWTLGLTFVVERQLFALCHHDATAVDRLRRFVDDRELKVRSRRSPRLTIRGDDHPLDHASFFELQSIVLSEDFSPKIPLTVTELNQVRHVRNLCAHLRPITWRAVRKTVEAISALADIG
jgi:hypothetical protein